VTKTFSNTNLLCFGLLLCVVHKDCCAAQQKRVELEKALFQMKNLLEIGTSAFMSTTFCIVCVKQKE